MSKPFIIGLTGSIGMGKSTTAELFAKEGVPVWNADATVHALYGPGGAAVPAIMSICPDAVTENGVDRTRLSDWIARNPDRLTQLERAIHPLVAESRRQFVNSATVDIVLVDIPLLYETGAEKDVDAVVVVTTSTQEQRRRVLARPGMTKEKLDLILSKQLPDSEKRARADFIIETTTIEAASSVVQGILATIRSRTDNA